MSIFATYRQCALSLVIVTGLPLTGLMPAFAIDGVATAADDRLIGTKQAETISGLEGDDHIRGGSGDDVLDGGPGDDDVIGQRGDDVLIGGPGKDRLTGGSGADTFRYLALSDSTPDSVGRDRITDFKRGHGDIIDLSEIDANSVEPGDQPFLFIGKEAFSGVAGELRYRREDDKTYVIADVNGDKRADFMILFPVKRTFIASEFKL